MAISSEGALRVALTTLAANGGFEVILRLPGLAQSGAAAEELGLSTPEFQDVPLWPAVWRKAGSNSALLIAGQAIANLVASQGSSSAEALFEAAVGVVVDGVLYRITRSEPLATAGVPCAYRVGVEAPVWS